MRGRGKRALGLFLVASGFSTCVSATWMDNQVIWVNSYTTNSQFASALAFGDVNGDGYADLVVGAPGTGNDPGRVYVFHGGPSGIQVQTVDNAATILTGPVAGSRFGGGLAAVGDVNGDGYDDILVAAVQEGGGRGAAYLFHGGPGGITAPVAARFAGDQDGALFGASVAGAGDVDGDGYDDVLIGATRYDLPGKVDAGAAFLFLGSAQGIASGGPASAKVRFEGGQANAWLGVVAGAGDVNGDGYDDILVGAGGAGTALLFLGRPGGPPGGGPAAASTRLTWPEVPAAVFGSAVAGVGDVNGDGYADIMVGAPGASGGSAFVFHGGPAGIKDGGPSTAQTRMNGTVSPFIAPQSLGATVTGAGDVNGDGYDDVLIGGAGTLLQLGGPAGVQVLPWRTMGREANFASIAAGGGDVNGDGIADVVVGDPGFSVGRGIFNLILGQPEGLRLTPVSGAVVKAGRNPVTARGSVAGIGDVNGDGYGDFAIGASGYGAASEGAVWIVLGGPARLSSTVTADAAGVRLTGDQPGGRFGYDVAGAGDVDGDGYDDLLVSAPGYDDPEPDEGVVFLFRGGPSGITARGPSEAAARIETDQAGAGLALVAGAGDVNGDGYADVLAGAPLYDGPEVDEGLVLLYLGSPGGLLPGARFESDQAGAHLGSVSGVGDVDGDGLADFILGAQGYSKGESREGAAFFFRGRPEIASGSVTRADAILESNQADAFLGGGDWRGTAAAGDVDADGYDDFLVSAAGQDTGPPSQDAGRVLLYRGGPAGIASGNPGSAAAIIESEYATAWLGQNSLAGLGDMHGKGYADLGMGSRFYLGTSRFFFYPGAATLSWPRTPNGANEMIPLVDLWAGIADGLAAAGDVDGDGYADVLAGIRDPDHGEWSAGLWYPNSRGGRPAAQLRQLRGKGRAVPVGHGGLSNAAGFRVEMTAIDPWGRGRAAKLEVEACPMRTLFGATGCVRTRSAAWTEIPAGKSGARLQVKVPDPTPGRALHWRARVLYARSGVLRPGIAAPPIPVHGPWRRLNGQQPGPDIRTGPPQQVFVQFVAPRGTATAGTTASVEVVLVTSDGLPARRATEVRWETRDATAVAGRDYVAGSGALAFPAGTASGARQSFAVGLLPGARPGVAFTLRLLGKDGTEWSQRSESLAGSAPRRAR